MMKVLFVDDDIGIVQGLKRMLRPLRDEWNMKFVSSGKEALDLLEREVYDVIISDMRMPEMNGVELLNQVWEKYPHMVRIILSEYVDEDLVMKVVRPAHQYLSKPCDTKIIINTVQRICKLQNALGSTQIKNIVGRIDTLPSLPSLYNEIIILIQHEDISIKNVAEIIQKDVGMTSQILKLVNSSFFGSFNKISNPTQAIALLGLDTIKTLVLSIGIFSALKNNKEMNFPYTHLWSHSALTADFARQIAKHITDDKTFIDDAFMVGFLHDIGILILASKLPGEYLEVLNQTRSQKVDLWKVEQKILGATHAEIGAYLLGIWGFPENIIWAIIRHHNLEIISDEPKSLCMLIHLADVFANYLDPVLKELNLSRLDQEFLKKINMYDQAKLWFKECKKTMNQGHYSERENFILG